MGGDGVRLAVVPAPQSPDVLAAGVVVFRAGRHVLLVHRPKYDDWSFPKGKLDPGEHRTTAAVREVLEETGLHVRLGPPLTTQHYDVVAGDKQVFYWTGRVVGDDDVEGYQPNEEIDAVRWVEADEAAGLLTYERDRETLLEALPQRRKTRAIVVLRHGKAVPRRSWHGDDRHRPLLQVGHEQAERLVPLLAAYDVTRVVSSPSTRCVQTVEPYVSATGWELETRLPLTEEDASESGIAAVAEEALTEARSVVMCSHRPVLPALAEALGVPDPQLEVGELVVLHARKGDVVAIEHLGPC